MTRYCIIILCVCSFQALAQHDFDDLYKSSPAFKNYIDTHQADFDLFTHDRVLEVSILSDFKSLNKKKDTAHYQKATIKLAFNDSVNIKRKIGIKARGNFRRETCAYPPIKLNFPKKKSKLEMLQTFDKMKMVGSCHAGENYQQYLLSEYFVYKMLNLLTDSSFRVRLIQVNYHDTGKKWGKVESVRYAFLIEPAKAMAKRLNRAIDENTAFRYGQFATTNRHMISLFNYMIGNTDFSIPARHNVKITMPLTESNYLYPLAVPYDFDYCGMVNPPYAIPAEQLPIENIQERLFRGPCEEFEIYQPTVEKFLSKKDEFYTLINQSTLLNKKSKHHMTHYLDSFFKILEDEDRLKEALATNCN